jgi:branched-chain amino acid transport system ATP-binding protein
MTATTDSHRRGTPPILEVRDVSKHFGGVRAVNGASLQVRQGEIVALIGPNGAGKTTLFNTVTGVIEPTSGAIVLRDAKGAERTLNGLRPDEVHCLGVSRTFQNIRLFANLRAIDNVALGAHPRGQTGLIGALLRLRKARREAQMVEEIAMRCLCYVGLERDAHTRAGSLAYGHQRRLEIARALANGPRLLLLDEPAAGMNPTETEELMALIRRIREDGITVLLIEHDMRLVMALSDHVYVLDHGEIICEGPPALVQNDARVVEAYLGPEAAAALAAAKH